MASTQLKTKTVNDARKAFKTIDFDLNMQIKEEMGTAGLTKVI